MVKGFSKKVFALNVGAMVLLALCALLGMMSFMRRSVLIGREQAYERLLESSAMQVRLINASIDGKYDILETSAGILGLGLASEEGEAREQIIQLCENGGFSSVGLANPEGLTILSSGETTNISDREYFAYAMQGLRAMTRIGRGEGKVSNEARFILSLPVYYEGEVTGVLFGSLLDENFQSLISSNVYSSRGYTFICDSSGDLILSDAAAPKELIREEPNFIELLSEENAEDISEAARADFAGLQEGLLRCTIDAGDYFATYTPLSLSDWMLVNVVPAESAEADINEMTQTGVIALMSLLALSMAFVAVTLWIAARRQHSLRESQNRVVSRLSKIAMTDSLTGLLNHEAAFDAIRELLSAEDAGRHALFIIDIDRFKQVNDKFGHPEGDRVLIETAGVIKALFRANDITGRLGGDEFVVLMRDAQETDTVLQRAAAVCEGAGRIRAGEDGGFEISASVGVALNSSGESFEELYRKADAALYKAKREGRSRFKLSGSENGDSD
ncbi:MAG: diguanylate cyclase [Oscillospiraceae bacterium]|nr:diguanylate cyclase [Oscillospiraceae bacterium]